MICGSSTEHLDKMVLDKESCECLFTRRFMCDLCASCIHPPSRSQGRSFNEGPVTGSCRFTELETPGTVLPATQDQLSESLWVWCICLCGCQITGLTGLWLWAAQYWPCQLGPAAGNTGQLRRPRLRPCLRCCEGSVNHLSLEQQLSWDMCKVAESFQDPNTAIMT